MEEVPHASRDTVEAVDGVHLTQLAVGERMSVQHFHIEPGATVPSHSHPEEQVGYVTRGTFTFVIGDEGSGTGDDESSGEAESPGDDESPGDGDGVEEYVVGPGDSYWIPAGEAHEARNETAEPVTGIDVFSPPRTSADWQR